MGLMRPILNDKESFYHPTGGFFIIRKVPRGASAIGTRMGKGTNRSGGRTGLRKLGKFPSEPAGGSG